METNEWQQILLFQSHKKIVTNKILYLDLEASCYGSILFPALQFSYDSFDLLDAVRF
jgi:hypothetical protein